MNESDWAPKTTEEWFSREERDRAHATRLVPRNWNPDIAAAVDAALAEAGIFARSRNMMVNGDFRINQNRVASGGSVTANVPFLDAWLGLNTTTLITWTDQIYRRVLTLGSPSFQRGMYQVIPRKNVRPGPAVLSWEGTALARVYNSGGSAPAYAASPILVTLDGLADLRVDFNNPAGSDGTVTDVQLEAGSYPTPFERISATQELQLLGLMPGMIPSSVVLGSGSALVTDDGTVAFTGASSVALNGVFDGLGMDTYELYIIFTESSSAYQYLRLRKAGVNTASGYNRLAVSTSLSGGPARSTTSPSTEMVYLGTQNTNPGAFVTAKVTIFNPKKGSPNTSQALAESLQAASDRYKWSEYGQGTSDHDGIALIASANTMTGFMKAVKVG